MVLKGGIDPYYVFNKMELYEARALYGTLNMKDKESWEQTRFLGYLIANLNGVKLNKPSDLLKFDWDSETPIENEEEKVDEIRDKMKKVNGRLNNKAHSRQ